MHRKRVMDAVIKPELTALVLLPLCLAFAEYVIVRIHILPPFGARDNRHFMWIHKASLFSHYITLLFKVYLKMRLPGGNSVLQAQLTSYETRTFSTSLSGWIDLRRPDTFFFPAQRLLE
ncbi:MAG: hypothetical protein NT010_15960 [Proteobacteria bacterium]|nr:hypothetical protein [Pseudomonadota bacterium]